MATEGKKQSCASGDYVKETGRGEVCRQYASGQMVKKARHTVYILV